MTPLNFTVTLATMSPRGSPAWLSYHMARALAATSPPLGPKDVVGAANELATQTDPVLVISRLLRVGSNLSSARSIVEALRALRDGPA
jgi:Flp pilus assembly protein CpaB